MRGPFEGLAREEGSGDVSLLQQSDVGRGEQLSHPLSSIPSGEGHVCDDAVIPGRAYKGPVQELTLDAAGRQVLRSQDHVIMASAPHIYVADVLVLGIATVLEPLVYSYLALLQRFYWFEVFS